MTYNLHPSLPVPSSFISGSFDFPNPASSSQTWNVLEEGSFNPVLSPKHGLGQDRTFKKTAETLQ